LRAAGKHEGIRSAGGASVSDQFRKGDPRRDDPDYHDPTAGVWGAPPAYSALNLRLVLAGLGLVFCIAGAIAFAIAGGWVLAVLLAVLAVVAVVDLVVVFRRRAALHGASRR
jgi:Flp pilus assembly protein TadB